jgi:glucose dehydrogenase
VFYGTLEGYLKASTLNGKELCKFKTPSGIIGNVFTYQHKGKQYVGVFSGIGGWAGIGMAAGWKRTRTVWVRWRLQRAARSTPISAVS